MSLLLNGRPPDSYRLNRAVLLSITATDCLVWAADRKEVIKSDLAVVTAVISQELW